LLLAITHYSSKFNFLNDLIESQKEKFLVAKIYEINDREPTYKLATYQGYKFPLERNRAQTELINYLKVKQICKTNPNTTIIDIGASLGFLLLFELFKILFTIFFKGEFGFYAAACGCQVYMFEIDPRKTFLIKKSIKLNSFQSRVYLIKKAVSDLLSNKTIYFSKNTSSQLYQSNNIWFKSRKTFSGQTISLNEYPFPSLLSFYIIRIDVQGHELHVFRSAEKLFREHRVNHVIFEYTPWGTQTPVQREIFQYMKDILGAKKFYALHPKQSIIYGPLNDGDINEFYSQHKELHLQRDVYAFFEGEEPNITANPYSFRTSF